MYDIASSSIVVTKVKNCLIVTISEDLSSRALEQLRHLVLRDIHKKNCSSIVFELSALKFMDTIEFEGLKAVAEMVAVLGARALFVGLQPGIIFHLIINNVETSGIHATLDLNQALETLGITSVESGN
jgi:rsbT antagonist protein RsbS